VEQYGFNAHQYADDTQLYGWCQLGTPHHYVIVVISEIVLKLWHMSSSRLQLNAGKTEFMWCVPPLRRCHLPADPLMVQSLAVAPLMSVRDLGVHLDYDMSMHTHVTHAAGSFVVPLRRPICAAFAGRYHVQH